MGKIFKGALLGAVSALGAYYYKNPKELEKHKELLKENTKTGIEKLTAIINEKTQELEARTQEEQDLAKEKLEELTATAESEKVEENFVELGAKAEEVKEEVVAEVAEKVEDVKETAEPVVEKAEEVAAPVVEKTEEVAAPAVEKAGEVVEDVKETLAPAAEPTFTKVEEVVESAKETVVDHYEEKVEPTFEEIHEAVAPVIEKAEEVKEEVEEVETTTDYKDADLSDEKENVTLDELIESENIEIEDEKDETTKEIEELNSNLEEIKQEKEKLENLEEKEEDEVDLVEEVAKIEDIEVEEYDEIKEPKKDRLEGYSDYHLDEGEIVELEEQNYLEENTDNVNIDSLLKDITANKKQQLHVANDVDKFTEEKTVPYEVVEKRQEAVRERANTIEEEVKPAQKVEEVEPVTQTEEVEETTGIEYTEKLYTEDVYSYFDSDKGTALGEYKTIDRGYRPVSKEKIEKNQKILDAIFEKYSTSSVNVPKKSVVNTMMETSTITPNSRSVGKFKPSPVYSSVYGSGSKPSPKKEESKKTTKNTKTNSNIYKEIASQDEAVWNIGTSKRVPKNKVKNKKTRK